MKTSTLISISICIFLLVIFVQQPAMAYVGPGTGIAALGAMLAIIAGVIVALFGFLWFPIKRIMNQRKAASRDVQEREEEKV